jgi:hypothetical protein
MADEVNESKMEDTEEVEEQEDEEGERCDYCEELIDECTCIGPVPACPVCDEVGFDGVVLGLQYLVCDHLIAGWDDGGFDLKVFEKNPFPDRWRSDDWTQEELNTAFGETEPLLYEDYIGTKGIGPGEFMEQLTLLVPGMVSSYYYSQDPSSMSPGWQAVMYCVEDPAAGKLRIRELASRLEYGFRYLEELALTRTQPSNKP